MSSEIDTSWGDQSFKRDRQWYSHLSTDAAGPELTKAEYNEHRDRALADPAYDLFAHVMPTGRPKHDIGRYVMRHFINVPLIRSMSEWQASLDDGVAMLRSELDQDYNGYSGLLSSLIVQQHLTYPRDSHGFPAVEHAFDHETGEYTTRQLAEGPVHAEINLSGMEILSNYSRHRAIGNKAIRQSIHDMLAQGLYDGTVNPTALMRLMRWDHEERDHYHDAVRYNFRPEDLGYAKVSRWQYIPGINLRVFRDPVIEGKYFIGGREAHHHWETVDGRDSPNLEAYDKGVYRGAPKRGAPEYTLPTQRIIDLYEQVRTLPYFDQRQVPVMELQYGDDSELYFLQYLKTGLTLGDPGAFELPMTSTSVPVNAVRGATKPTGEQVRIYLDPWHLSRGMEKQGVFIGMSLGGRGHVEQVAAMQARVAVSFGLNFKDNHFSSTTLTRTPLALGLWDGVGAAHEQFMKVERQRPFNAYDKPYDNQLEFINAHVTSNGRQAVIDSDWQVRKERL